MKNNKMWRIVAWDFRANDEDPVMLDFGFRTREAAYAQAQRSMERGYRKAIVVQTNEEYGQTYDG